MTSGRGESVSQRVNAMLVVHDAYSAAVLDAIALKMPQSLSSCAERWDMKLRRRETRRVERTRRERQCSGAVVRIQAGKVGTHDELPGRQAGKHS